MIKQSSFILIAVLLVNILAFPQMNSTEEALQSANVKADVQKRGIGEKSRVTIKLHKRELVRGYISKIDETSFDITDKNTGRATTISYADVERVQGRRLSKGAKIGIGVGGAVVVVVAVMVVALSRIGPTFR